MRTTREHRTSYSFDAPVFLEPHVDKALRYPLDQPDNARTRTAAAIFAQGDPATSVMYVEKGTVRLSVLSHAGKQAVVAVLEAGDFFG